MLAVPVLLALLSVAPVPTPRPADPGTGAEVIRLMQARGAKGWYQAVTFVQRTTQADGSVATWYEALRIPGRLRIDIAPIASGNVMLFRNDSIYRYVNGELKLSRPLVHPLLLLGFDVYGQPAEATSSALEKLGYDLTKVHAATWQGRKVWVVGALAGDSTSKQFWVDQERLVFVRDLGPHPQKEGVLTEVQFNKYVALGKGWIETEVLFLENGKVRLTEEYTQLAADPAPALVDALYEPGPYRAPGWITD